MVQDFQIAIMHSKYFGPLIFLQILRVNGQGSWNLKKTLGVHSILRAFLKFESIAPYGVYIYVYVKVFLLHAGIQVYYMTEVTT